MIGTAETDGGAVVKKAVAGSIFPILRSAKDLLVVTVKLLMPVFPVGQL